MKKQKIRRKDQREPSSQKGKQTPNSPRKWTNVFWSRGLVKMSASWRVVSMRRNLMSPFSSWSRRKWKRTSMCLVLECSMGFLATLMALVLSQSRGTWWKSKPKSRKVAIIQSNCEQHLATATYSASVVDTATLDYFREDHETNEVPKNWQVLEVDLRSKRQPAKSTSE